MTVKSKINTAKNNLKDSLPAGRKFSTELGVIGTFFILMVTISNVAYQIFGFKLLPVFEDTFDAFHATCQFILHLLVFSWLTSFLELIGYGLISLWSCINPIIPWWPNITIPNLVTDFALVSLAFTRVFQRTDFVVPRQERAEAERMMTPKHWLEIKQIEGPFWGTIHRLVEVINKAIWDSIEFAHRLISYPFRKFPRVKSIIKIGLISIAGSVFMWGFIRLIGYIINVLAARRLLSPIMVIRKRFFRYFMLNLLAAIVAAAIFIILNGWFLDWTAPEPINSAN